MTGQDDLTFIQTTLAAARRGGSSLPQLADAREKAVALKLGNCAAECNQHLLDRIPHARNGRAAVAVFLGIFTGLVTNALLYGFGYWRKKVGP